MNIRNKIMIIIFSGIAISFCLLMAEEFTKKKKLTSAPEHLKQEYAQVCAQVVQCFPDLLRACADIHERMTHDFQAVMDGDKQSFCMRATKNQLESCKAKLEGIRDQMQRLRQELVAYTELEQSLYS